MSRRSHSCGKARRSRRPASTPIAWRRYAAVERWSSIGRAAAAASAPKRVDHASARARPPAQSTCAAGERLGLARRARSSAPTEPSARRTDRGRHVDGEAGRRRWRSPWRCARRPWRSPASRRGRGTVTAVISSPGRRAVRFDADHELGAPRASRAPVADCAGATTASSAASTGSPSPAGEHVPRLPPIVAALRICGEPTVRAAWASAGSSVGERRAQQLARR